MTPYGSRLRSQVKVKGARSLNMNLFAGMDYEILAVVDADLHFLPGMLIKN